MVKIFTYKGMTIEQIQKLSLEEYAKMIPSRYRRSLLRGVNEDQKKLLERLRKGTKPVRTHRREMVILPEMVGKTIMLHTGKDWQKIDISPEMLGRRLGEFALTRKKVSHSAPGVGATRSSKFMPLK
jgi:small subunit ribosomal protein S19